MQYRNVKKQTVLRTHILQDLNVQQQAVRSFYKLILRVLVQVALNQADCFSLGIRVYEETVIDVIVYQVSHDILNP